MIKKKTDEIDVSILIFVLLNDVKEIGAERKENPDKHSTIVGGKSRVGNS